VPRKLRYVLVVDDNPAARRVVVHLLRADPAFRVRGVAHDGLEAVELTGEDCPDLIVLDHEMPRMTGLEALPKLREQCPGARIVMWSLSDDVADHALAAGGDGFVSKAEPIDALLDWLRRAA
jgi:CheY-like chemotaxis protein